MAKYEIEFKNIKRRSEEWLETLEFDGAFTKTAFENVVCTLFFYAAQKSIDYKMLDAIVNRDGKKVLHFVMDTHVGGSTIYADLKVARPREKYRFLRRMMIAQ